MIITYQGAEFFKVQFGDTTLAFNPISKESKLKPTRFFADIALVSVNHPDANGVENLAYNGKEPFVISGPGEYEIKGVFIKGFASKSKYGGKDRINTVYSVSLENMNICFLGALSDRNLSKEVKEELGDVDILFLPVGGDGVLDAAEAEKLSVEIEPKIIIPMQYDAASLKKYLKEAGDEGVKPIEKLTLKKKDLDGKEGETVVLAVA
ncbi:MAG: MBL fold metallo-hydrolase [Patescibacteria group bacterium]|nr:MBL fold metallo-hydrolase [Patescibacteria group bacterium]MDE1946051.1 MBL fold metallo-hydrolase [Patescibacteria group bacterium]